MCNILMDSSKYVPEQQFILRVPEHIAPDVKQSMEVGDVNEKLSFEFSGDGRHAVVRWEGKQLSGKLVDLPCIIESHKTVDKKTLYKTGDVCQMLVVTDEDPSLDSPEELEDRLSLSKRKELIKKFQWNHGITPPLKNVRKRRFRKTAPKKYIDSPEIEKEVRRLLREDLQAKDVKFEVVVEEDRQDDASVIGSRVNSPTQVVKRQTAARAGVPSDMLESDEDDDLAEILQATSSEDEGDDD
ncbi:transcription initiation factor TFIID subunit 7-like [Corticium candelabrum]|uniref:transcription initiation factor TFIID subunit 7-like n=1 Tax=Corticium candelabrum TaxID=121492 RepID=UPI002E25D650|nr:transcription initiation factor TFIID subunit 7-like [Corticium candelabrum]